MQTIVSSTIMDSIELYYQNVRWLRSKTNILFNNVLSEDYGIICLTETSLISSIMDSEILDLQRYAIFRRDRDYTTTGKSRGGGVLIGVQHHISVILRSDWSSSAEDLWITISLPHSKAKVHLCCAYFSPDNHHASNINEFLQRLTEIRNNHPDDNFLLVGDYNFPKILWSLSEPGHGLLPSNSTDILTCNLIDTMSFLNLTQYNSQVNKLGRTLDLVLSDMTCKVKSAVPLVPIDEYHPALLVDIPIANKQLRPNARSMKLYGKADYETINNDLAATDWSSVLSNCGMELATERFYSILNRVIDAHVPSKKTTVSNYPSWYDTSLIKIIKEKRKYHRKWKSSANLAHYETFSLLRSRQKRVCKSLFEAYIRKSEECIKENSKFFWRYVKSKRSSPGIPQMMYLNDTKAKTGIEICELFSEYFQSVYENPSMPSAYRPLSDPLPQRSVDINTISFNEETTYKYLKNIDQNKSSGSDNIHPFFVSNCALTLARPLTLLFKMSLKEGLFPDCWKKAYICPIYKQGPRNKVDNYRPISKLPIFSKLMEKIVFDILFPIVRDIIAPEQHGFFKKRSVESNLITFTDSIQKSMDSRAQIDVLYTDFSKAFDKINHNILLDKIWALGIRGDLFRWISSYIRNRSQAVVIDGHQSRFSYIHSGVPQGSHLGPLLFLLYINDITTYVHHSDILIYADDTKIFREINTLDDCALLQEDIDRVSQYCKHNCIFINASKCHVMTFSRKSSNISHVYLLNGNQLNSVTSIRDLGVMLDSKMIFADHIDYAITKANKLLGFILRVSTVFKSTDTLKLLFNCYVRSHLEFASVIWNPQYATYISRLEAVQRKFVKRLNYMSYVQPSSYAESLRTHNILSLQDRRSLIDLTFLHKILNNSVDSISIVEKIKLSVPSRQTRSHRFFHLPLVKTNSARNSFLYRACHSYNIKFSDVDVFATSIGAFKSAIVKILQTHEQF